MEPVRDLFGNIIGWVYDRSGEGCVALSVMPLVAVLLSFAGTGWLFQALSSEEIQPPILKVAVILACVLWAFISICVFIAKIREGEVFNAILTFVVMLCIPGLCTFLVVSYLNFEPLFRF